MEYQKVIDLLNNIPNQPTKFRTINRVEIDDKSQGSYKDTYVLVKETVTIANIAAEVGALIMLIES